MNATLAQQIIHALKQQNNKVDIEAFFKRFDTDFKGCLVLEDNLSSLLILAENMNLPAFKKLADYKDDIIAKFSECGNGFVTEYYPLFEKYQSKGNQVLDNFSFSFSYFYYCTVKFEAIAKKLSLQLSAEMQALIKMAKELNESSVN